MSTVAQSFSNHPDHVEAASGLSRVAATASDFVPLDLSVNSRVQSQRHQQHSHQSAINATTMHVISSNNKCLPNYKQLMLQTQQLINFQHQHQQQFKANLSLCDLNGLTNNNNTSSSHIIKFNKDSQSLDHHHHHPPSSLTSSAPSSQASSPSCSITTTTNNLNQLSTCSISSSSSPPITNSSPIEPGFINQLICKAAKTTTPDLQQYSNLHNMIISNASTPNLSLLTSLCSSLSKNSNKNLDNFGKLNDHLQQQSFNNKDTIQNIIRPIKNNNNNNNNNNKRAKQTSANTGRRLLISPAGSSSPAASNPSSPALSLTSSSSSSTTATTNATPILRTSNSTSPTGNNKNNNLRSHLCHQCGRTFSRSDMLTRHSRLHSGVKPYQCNKCHQVFSRSDHLSTHERTHTGEKPFRCEHCSYSACRRDMITRHMRTHTTSSTSISSVPSARLDTKNNNRIFKTSPIPHFAGDNTRTDATLNNLMMQ